MHHNMPPSKIVDALRQAGITQAGIARDLGVTITHVNNVIHRGGVSDRVRRHIAKAIGRKVEDVWPETYKVKADPTRLGRPVTKGLFSA